MYGVPKVLRKETLQVSDKVTVGFRWRVSVAGLFPKFFLSSTLFSTIIIVTYPQPDSIQTPLCENRLDYQRQLHPSWSKLVRDPSTTFVQNNTLIGSTVVLGASGGIGQASSYSTWFLGIFLRTNHISIASVPPLQGLSARWWAFALRCCQYSRRRCGSLAYVYPSSMCRTPHTACFQGWSSKKLTGYLPKDDGLKHALTGADVVIIPAGIPRTLPFKQTTVAGSSHSG